MNTLDQAVNEIERDGFVLIKSVYQAHELAQLLEQLNIAIREGSSSSIKSSLGETYAARNLAEHNSRLLTCWKKSALDDFLRDLLGDKVGLVRLLYFDKHPNRTWALPWHKDMTVAVKDNSIASSTFTKPTRKSGVDHLEASTEQLEKMVTLRIHLDDVTEDNGPLEVAVGSHHNGKEPSEENRVHKVLCRAGDVLAMRPLISHASGCSTKGTTAHRRILHLEFSANETLPDSLEWHSFYPVFEQ